MIPKVIYRTWYTKRVHRNVRKEHKKIIELNPNYSQIIYTDKEIDDFVKDTYEKDIFNSFISLKNIVAKADFWRYLILYESGGVYLDMDSTINKNLEEIIENNNDAVLSVEGNNMYVVQWALIFNKRHKILEYAIENILQNMSRGLHKNDIHKLTGPHTFTKSVTKFLDENNLDEGIENFDKEKVVEVNKNQNITKIFGLDYNQYFIFKHESAEFLNSKYPHWWTTQKLNDVY